MPEQTRTVRSFVRRKGRITEAQQRALDEDWIQFGLNLEDGAADFAQIFGRNAPRTLEIGCGMGQATLAMAEAAPEQDFIGVEVHEAGIGSLLLGIKRLNLTNLRLYHCDALDVLKHCIADSSLSRVLLFFPDPWHKKRHHKRRIVQPEFIELLRPKLNHGGIFHLASDWQPYAQHMLDVMNAAPGWRNLAEDGRFIPRPAERPLTKFEQRGERLGHGIFDLKFIRTD